MAIVTICRDINAKTLGVIKCKYMMIETWYEATFVWLCTYMSCTSCQILCQNFKLSWT